MASKNTTVILKQMRGLMSNLEVVSSPIEAYIIPSSDAHYSEYTADCDNRRAFVTGFDGSAGTAIVTKSKALLWTDGRYYIQATQQIDNNWTLMKQGLPETPTQAAWLSKNLGNGASVGVDPMLFTQDEWDSLSKELHFTGKSLMAVKQNLVDLVWPDRPLRPEKQIIELDVKFSGKSTRDKIGEVRKEVVDAGCEILLVTELDEIAWLLNLRGSDIIYNPVVFSYVILTTTGLEIFINTNKLSEKIRKNLEGEVKKVEFFPYDFVGDRLQHHVKTSKGRIFVSKKCNHFLTAVIPEERRTMRLTPIAIMKALKNPVEIKGMHNAHIRDAAALCEFFAWLETEIRAGTKITEISAADKLEQFRAAQKHFMGLSFASISSSGPNGAVIHYHPQPATNRPLSPKEMYLIDSGGQYLDGTTDVTRTLHFATPTDFQRDCFTRVLKGNIALVSAIFPTKVIGNTLDTLARKALWDVGLDYIHGTGHGIGHFLNVHEGPHGITYRLLPDDPGLQENMFVSNEPGYYHENEFGIRIENIIRIVPAKNLPNNFANRGYLTFEDVTFVPIQQKLIDTSLLTAAEIKYIDKYHKECREKVGAYIEENGLSEGAREWLLRATEPLHVTSP